MQNDEDFVRIGKFVVNVSTVTKDALKSMRTYWPMEEYRLLKNRKSARICRQRRKNERVESSNDLNVLKRENDQLRVRVHELEQQLVNERT